MRYGKIFNCGGIIAFTREAWFSSEKSHELTHMGQYAATLPLPVLPKNDYTRQRDSSAARGDDTTHNLDRNFAQLLYKWRKTKSGNHPSVLIFFILFFFLIILCIPVSIYIRRHGRMCKHCNIWITVHIVSIHSRLYGLYLFAMYLHNYVVIIIIIKRTVSRSKTTTSQPGQ